MFKDDIFLSYCTGLKKRRVLHPIIESLGFSSAHWPVSHSSEGGGVNACEGADPRPPSRGGWCRQPYWGVTGPCWTIVDYICIVDYKKNCRLQKSNLLQSWGRPRKTIMFSPPAAVGPRSPQTDTTQAWRPACHGDIRCNTRQVM